MTDNYKDHLYALILAGGGGTRLWPRSLNKTPKQFLKLFDKRTLFQITSKRLNIILSWDKIYCVTVSEEYKKEILKEVPEFIPRNIIVEPARRDTAPAHGIGAMYIYNKDPEAVIVTESADRLVKPVTTYLKTLKMAAKYAYENKKMVAIGIKPTYPNIGYGHIKKGQKLAFVEGIKFFKLLKFVEKPPLKLAQRYTSSGEYYWNAGQFVWRADNLLDSINRNAKDIGINLERIKLAIGTEKEKTVVKKAYEKMPKISIDYAIVEKEKNFVLVTATFFWTDIGDWNEVWKNLNKDEMGNVIIDGEEKGGRVINIDTSDALIHTDGRLISIIDVDNIVVVDTPKALLICAKSRAQNVKKIVEQLKAEGENELL